MIKIIDYKIRCVLGVYPQERAQEQEVSIDLDLSFDLSKCVKSDSLIDTIDYTEIATCCKELVIKRQYHLIETLAFEVLEMLFEKFPLYFAKIRVVKRKAVAGAFAVAVEMEKKR